MAALRPLNHLGPARPHLLLVSADESLLEGVCPSLADAGYTHAVAPDAAAASAEIEKRRPSLVIMDWALPLIAVLEVCRELKGKPSMRGMPLIMLAARPAESERIRGLRLGQDDAITRPVTAGALVARIRDELRRVMPAEAAVLTCGELSINLSSHRVFRGSRRVHLGPTEFRLLRVLFQRPGEVFSREDLLTAVWQDQADVEARTVDVHVRRLRQALNESNEPDLIRTVRSVGYALEATVPDDRRSAEHAGASAVAPALVGDPDTRSV